MVIIFILFSIFVIYSIIAYILFTSLFTNKNKLFILKANKSYVEANELGTKWLFENKNTKDIYIKTNDNLKLRGIFIEGNKYLNRTIICVHGFKTKTGLDDFGMTLKFLCESGYNILVLDNRSYGKSEGIYTGFSILDSKDVVEWAKYLVNNLKQEKIILYGLSMGAATVINAVGNKELPFEVKGICSDSSFSNAYEEMSNQIRRYYNAPSFPLIVFYNTYLKIFAKYSLKDIKPIEEIRKFNGIVLLIHGDKDLMVPTKNVYNLYDNVKGEKDILVVNNASHCKSYLVDKAAYESKFSSLIDKVNNL